MSRYGCIPSFANRVPKLSRSVPTMTLAQLPPSIDLSASLPPVLNQVSLGSCTAHGVTEALRYNMIDNGDPDVPLSRLQMYYDSRAMEGSIASDAGAQIHDVIKVAAKGVGREDLWPYDLTKWGDQPPAAVYADAIKHEAMEYRGVDVDPLAIKTALFTGRPVIIGITVYESFESDPVTATGIVPMPGNENIVGGHCMLCWGYGQKSGYFSVRNSWGADWGDGGNCYLPEGYMGSPDYASDLWVISSNLA
jgi:C1A family cysteine protease